MFDLSASLERFYGFSSFRGPQQEICEHFLAGGSALVLMATGDGKSLCYQLPAFVGEGLTLVVSPLIALMDDQTAALQAKNLPATCIHSMLTADERQARLAAVERGEIRLLYVTPERFRVGIRDREIGGAKTETFLSRMQRLDLVKRIAIDEAHCLSQWGHDFRPDYQRLGAVRKALGDVPCLALTATATPAVQTDIRSTLGFGDGDRLFHTGIARDNLFLSVHETLTDQDKFDRLAEVLGQTGGPAIVYCALIKDLRLLESELQRRGFFPMVYHGDLSAHERRSQQAKFQKSDDALMLATNAFGMGVDKPNIRAILHWQIPRTLEAYYQEVGRAGRDGDGAFCELLYREDDLVIQRNFTEWANPTADFACDVIDHMISLGDRLHAADVDTLRATFLHKNRHDGRIDTVLRLLRAAGCTTGEPGHDLKMLRVPDAGEVAAWLPDDKRKNDLMGRLKMVRYASEPQCRKATIHAHFGFEDEFPEPPPGQDGRTNRCGACDICLDANGWQEARMPAPKPLTKGRSEPAADDAPSRGPKVERGDWLDIQGIGLCCVVRVHKHNRSTRVDVERASDLKPRSVDLGRRRWKRVKN
ncbi:MAG: ATP-dependent DNA helicase RecQ [Planctomycetota bacterium]